MLSQIPSIMTQFKNNSNNCNNNTFMLIYLLLTSFSLLTLAFCFQYISYIPTNFVNFIGEANFIGKFFFSLITFTTFLSSILISSFFEFTENKWYKKFIFNSIIQFILINIINAIFYHPNFFMQGLSNIYLFSLYLSLDS